MFGAGWQIEVRMRPSFEKDLVLPGFRVESALRVVEVKDVPFLCERECECVWVCVCV